MKPVYRSRYFPHPLLSLQDRMQPKLHVVCCLFPCSSIGMLVSRCWHFNVPQIFHGGDSGLVVEWTCHIFTVWPVQTPSLHRNFIDSNASMIFLSPPSSGSETFSELQKSVVTGVEVKMKPKQIAFRSAMELHWMEKYGVCTSAPRQSTSSRMHKRAHAYPCVCLLATQWMGRHKNERWNVPRRDDVLLWQLYAKMLTLQEHCFHMQHCNRLNATSFGYSFISDSVSNSWLWSDRI